MDIKQIQENLSKFNLRHRPSQLTMIAQVHNTLSKGNIICIEAATGTGKTLGYLLGAFHAKKDNQKIIISTATIALQEQLIKKDLPLFEKIVGKKIRFALAKGRQNYLCLAKLKSEEQNDFFNKKEFDALNQQVENTFWDGDRENLNTPISPHSWQDFTTDSNGCSGKHCEYYEQCYFFKARNKIYSADIIVTNHNLLLSDLSLGGGVLLPELEKNIYIIDECHHLPERSISHFAKSSRVLNTIEWINQINFSVQRAISTKHINDSWQPKVNQLTRDLVTHIKSLMQLLESNQTQFNDIGWRITEQAVDQFESIKFLKQLSNELAVALNSIVNILETELDLKKPEKDNENLQQLINHQRQIKFLQSRVIDFHATWNLFCHKREPKEPPVARWFEKINTQSQPDYCCHCSPINVGSDLTELFWKRIENGALLCSATIRCLGKFDHFIKKTGLHTIEHVNTNSMPLIFNYQQSVLFVPSMKAQPSGKEQQEHRNEALNLLPQLILPRSGTLVLFTSKSAMEDTYYQLPSDIAFDILMQGKKSKSQLIEAHKKQVRAGKRSIIFGLASFAEGIDLPAKFCQHVIIHKLPFAVPTTPVELTRSEWIIQHQLNPFMLATLPETSIKLTQYIGRLIRQEEDKGIVSILDRRIYSKNYGKKLLDNLPGFTRLINCSVETLKKEPAIAELFAQ